MNFHSIRCIMKLVVCFISPRQEARGYKTHNSFHNTSYEMKIHLRSYICFKANFGHDFVKMHTYFFNKNGSILRNACIARET